MRKIEFRFADGTSLWREVEALGDLYVLCFDEEGNITEPPWKNKREQLQALDQGIEWEPHRKVAFNFNYDRTYEGNKWEGRWVMYYQEAPGVFA